MVISGSLSTIMSNNDLEFVGTTETMIKLKNLIHRASHINRSILIYGATGTGKELVARTLHKHSPFQDKPFVTVHCGALPENLFESELFGHKRGAFTGATEPREGLIQSAKNGILFLDEVNSLPMNGQGKLLRFLESGEYRQIGSNQVQKSNVWVIAATNENLQKRAKEKTFRSDLLYRLDIIRINLPSLKERGYDILLLAEHFLNKISSTPRKLTHDAQAAILQYSWPGNVRELKHRVEAAALLSDSPLIDAEALGFGNFYSGINPEHQSTESTITFPPLARQLWSLVESEGMTLGEAMNLCELLLIRQALQSEDNNRTKAAARLGIHVRTIFKKISHFSGNYSHDET